MEIAIDCPAAFYYPTITFNVRRETTNTDALVSEDGVQNKQIVEEFDRSQR